MSLIPPKGKTVSTTDFYNWTHQQHGEKKCFCGQFACIGFNYRYGMLELLCFKHYEERIGNEINSKTKKTTNGSTESYYEKKEKERKIICHKEKELTEVKEVDHQRSLL